ncbi:5'-nucleotidase, lipoprotein e(P4) family [Rhodohalobacter sp. 8-1]|uniref:5'-nucleotidase, lipoprotein e(P4) family n=1 Tax=Rhodohalobacter sp. 8-1 TaxID=3131972 RepID=UPI0030EEEFC8
MKKYFTGFAVLFLLASCGTADVATDSYYSNNTLYSTLWIQTAAEYEALTYQAYNTSVRLLPVALDDSFWTASLEQGESFADLPPAIILDVDETVLDNSYYEARGILDETGYDPDTWNAWVREMEAEAIKGAVELTSQADDMGISVFYITNRSADVQSATEQNLRDEGFPVAEGAVMSNGGRPDWTSAKTERRQLVADDYRVLMLFGDDLNDFVSARGISINQRKQLVEEHRDKWGYKWFVFPNPNYGSWERALYTGDEQTDEERQQSRLDRLETKREN